MKCHRKKHYSPAKQSFIHLESDAVRKYHSSDKIENVLVHTNVVYHEVVMRKLCTLHSSSQFE